MVAKLWLLKLWLRKLWLRNYGCKINKWLVYEIMAGSINYGSKSHLCNCSKHIAGQDVEYQHPSTEGLKSRI